MSKIGGSASHEKVDENDIDTVVNVIGVLWTQERVYFFISSPSHMSSSLVDLKEPLGLLTYILLYCSARNIDPVLSTLASKSGRNRAAAVADGSEEGTDEGKVGLTALNIGSLRTPAEFCPDNQPVMSSSPDIEDVVEAAENRVLSSALRGEGEYFLGVRVAAGRDIGLDDE